MTDQPDFFLKGEQLALFAEAPQKVARVDPDKVRRELLQMLAEARAAEVMPWPGKTLRLYRTIFPQMSRWLPDDEARQLCLDFENEVARLAAA